MTVVRTTASVLALILASSFSALTEAAEPQTQGDEAPLEPLPAPPARPSPAPSAPSAPAPSPTPSPAPPQLEPRASVPAPPPPPPAIWYAEGGTVVRAAPPRPPFKDRWSVEPLLGFGSNDYNFGLGARIGYTFRVPFYIGGTLMWHSGEWRDFVGPRGFTETWKSFSYPAAEIGYDIALGQGAPVVVRPYAGAGALFRYEQAWLNGFYFASDVDTEFLVYPGLTAHYRIPHGPAFVGVDTRLLVPVATTELSYQAFAVLGMSL